MKKIAIILIILLLMPFAQAEVLGESGNITIGVNVIGNTTPQPTNNYGGSSGGGSYQRYYENVERYYDYFTCSEFGPCINGTRHRNCSTSWRSLYQYRDDVENEACTTVPEEQPIEEKEESKPVVKEEESKPVVKEKPKEEVIEEEIIEVNEEFKYWNYWWVLLILAIIIYIISYTIKKKKKKKANQEEGFDLFE